MRAYIGGATIGQGSPAAGIVVVDIDGPRITEVGRGATATGNPMYQALSADGAVLYTVHERTPGFVSAWAVDGTGLRPLGEPQSAGADATCHVSLHPDGTFLFAANYGSGVAAVLPVRDDGSLGPSVAEARFEGTGPVTERQSGSHAHQVLVDPVTGPARGHVLVTDLGGDRVHRYRLDPSSGALAEADAAVLSAGSGPRHLVISGRYGYVAGELDSTVTVLDLSVSPPEVVSSVPTVRDDAPGPSYPSAIRLGVDRRFLYVANRGPDEIAVLAVDGAQVELVGAVPCGGVHPRDLTLSPDGRHLFASNQFSDAVVSFAIHADTGLPTPTGDVFATGSPSCLTFA